jgi:hypothetical protein
MRLERTKRYVAALLCAVGLSLFGNTVWADGSTFTWTWGDGRQEKVDEKEARNRCTQCQQKGNNAGSNFNCVGNVQMCGDLNITIVINPSITVGP